WVAEIETRKEIFMHKDGQPLYDWQIGGMLEVGDYLLTVYGASPKEWTKGKGKDFLFVANGFEKGPADGSLVFTIPEWGRLAYQVPKNRLVSFLALDRSPASDTFLHMCSMPDKAGDRLGRSSGSCRIPKKALIPVCSAWSYDDQRNLLTITGQSGTTGQLQWGRYNDSYSMADGDYGRVKNSLSFESPESSNFLVSTHDVPIDTDAAPLSCMLETTRYRHPLILERDLIKLSPKRAFNQQFNYNGREETVWFEVVKSGVYQIATPGELRNRCVLYDMQGTKRRLVRDTDPGATQCNIVKHLPPGSYELKIYGGKEGIERLKISCMLERPFPGKSVKPDSTQLAKVSCLIPSVSLQEKQRYRLWLSRTGAATSRGLILRQLPLKLERPLPLVLNAKDKVKLDTAAGREVVIRSAGGGKFSCSWDGDYEAKARDGICRLPAISQRKNIEIINTTQTTLAVSVHRSPKPKQQRSLENYSPVIPPLPKLFVNKPKFFNFDRGQSHSMIFDVKQPGLYHVTTRGLLGTECRMRTAIVSRLVSDTGSGRGRNCLLARFLNPGRYLLTVKTKNRSRGRASVEVSERPVKKGKSLSADKEAFFRVKANELIRQDLKIITDGKFHIRTSGQVVSLQCRLDDQAGWPIVPVPTRCDQTLELDQGKYLWTQMPITVESMRRTQLNRIKPAVVLRGNKPHPIELNTWYSAELGEDGKDDFILDLKADLEIRITLDNGMQGRIYRSRKGKPQGELIEPIPPNRGAVTLKVSSGRYRLVTEHSRADVGINYRLYVESQILAPGMTKQLHIPSESVVRMPAKGVLRLKTSGQTDVRCRLFNDKNQLVAESGSHGADWNCLIATPLAAGDYRLVLEAENTIAGTTMVSLVATETKDIGILDKDSVFKPAGKVLTGLTAKPSAGQLQEFHFRSKLSFACALEDRHGKILQFEENIRHCQFLIHPKENQYRIRLWSKNWRAKIRASVGTRKLAAFSSGRLEKNRAGLVSIPRAGHYKTGKRIWCLPEAQSGLLQSCGPQASLEAGAVIFSGTGQKAAELSLTELVSKLGVSKTESIRLASRPHIQRQHSSKTALHLVRVELPFGEVVSPACRIDGGITAVEGNVCFAASGPVKDSLVRWWIPGKANQNAKLVSLGARVPKEIKKLKPGVQNLVWSGPVVKLQLPMTPTRIELVLPGDAWVLQLDKNGGTVDLCPPQGKLSRCILNGQGGQLYITSNAERRARAKVLLEQQPVPAKVLRKVFESRPRAPGRIVLKLPVDSNERQLEVFGAERCTLSVPDGTRTVGCRAKIAAGQSAEVIIAHSLDPVRAVLFSKGSYDSAHWAVGLPSIPGAGLMQAHLDKITGKFVKRTLSLEQPAVIHLHSDSGVCALASAQELIAVNGLGNGCDIQRLLPAGSYNFLVRSFAEEALAGSMVWSADRFMTLHEGIGPDQWLAPSEVRIFRFETHAKGEVGIGLRVAADVLECTTLDSDQRVIGEGCLQFLLLDKGVYLLRVAASKFSQPVRFRPVILGLSGSKIDVPEDYLRDFFRRIGERP
ncbi:MAG: hypothetical protein JRJ87_09880, partial [Deltaproteobacteria bacterium]|nr:hypothetical protein [Deltaproteobacteria bacterium]